MRNFSVRFQDAGVASSREMLRGYIRTAANTVLRMQVAAPGRRCMAFANGRPVRSRVAGGLVTFSLPTRAGRAADWAVVSVR
jgi:hypothetical protein